MDSTLLYILDQEIEENVKELLKENNYVFYALNSFDEEEDNESQNEIENSEETNEDY